jgi:type I restriction enzyme, S subunit
MAGDWRPSTWGEEVSLEYGKALRDYDAEHGKYRVFGSNGPIGWTDKPLVPGPGVILGRKGAYRGIEFSREPFFVIDTAYYVVPKSEFDMRWLYYAIKYHKLGEIDDGSPIPSTTRSAVYVRDFDVPPIAEQRAIASVLGALDDKIELNRRMNATLEAMARALFQSWFVDFDPVRAKQEGRKPTGMDDATAALFPEHLENSPLGHIPKGWKATTLGACIGFRSGFSFKSQDWQETGVPVVKIGSVKPGIIDLTQVSYVSEEIAHQAARYRLTTGDMLIGMTGYVGEVGLVPPSDNPPLLNQRVGKFVMAKPGTESLGFWYCATRQPEFKAFVEARSHGTAQANVSGESIMEFSLVVPPAGILDAFNRDCQPLLDRILSNHGESRTLATLRDTLLPKLLSGELSVESEH